MGIEVGSPLRFAAALELVDVTRPPDDFEKIVAENIWHRGVAFGPFTETPPPDRFPARVTVDGQVRGETEGSVDVEEALRVARRLLPAVADRLEPGDRIIAGSILQVPVTSGEVTVELGPLGRVGLVVL